MSAENLLNQPAPTVETAPALDSYVPMPDPISVAAEEPKRKTYEGADTDAVRAASEDLSKARSEGRVPKAESEEITDRSYINYATGEPVEANQTLDPLRAARDLTAVRDREFHNAQHQPAEIAQAVDDVRRDFAEASQPQQPTEQPAQPAETQQQIDGIDPEIKHYRIPKSALRWNRK